MKNETKESQNTARASVVINIHGGNNQILPNATEVVQNFYGAEFAHVRTQNNGMEEKEEDEAVRIARSTLCIYYSDDWELNDIIRRIADCRSASDLANLVWTCMSEKSFSADVHWMTIFTPAYQREATMECFYRTLITDVYSFIGKCLVLAFMPAGYLLSRK